MSRIQFPHKLPPRVDAGNGNDYSSGNSGGEPPMNSDRITRMEQKLENVQKDVDRVYGEVHDVHKEVRAAFWWIFSIIVAASFGITAVIKGTVNTHQEANKQQLDAFDKRWSSIIDERQNRHDEAMQRFDETMKRQDAWLEKIHAIELRMERNAANQQK